MELLSHFLAEEGCLLVGGPLSRPFLMVYSEVLSLSRGSTSQLSWQELEEDGNANDFDILPSLSLRCRLATERKGIPRLLPSWFLLPRRLPEGMAWLSP